MLLTWFPAVFVPAFIHTAIDERFRGHGLAAKLVAEALNAASTEGLLVEPYCSYVASFITKHPEYLSLIPDGRRAEFGLHHAPVGERKSA